MSSLQGTLWPAIMPKIRRDMCVLSVLHLYYGCMLWLTKSCGVYNVATQ